MSSNRSLAVAALFFGGIIALAGDINAPGPDGTTPLHWAAQNGDLETAKKLLRTGANANAENRYGVTPLLLAAANRDAAMGRLLLEAGADANHSSTGGETVLMTAARIGSPELVQLL